MKQKFFLLLIGFFFAWTAKAQSGSIPPVDPLLKGKDLLQQLAKGLDPSAFVNSWTADQQRHWLNEMSKKTDASGLAESLDDFTEYLKPTSWKDGFSLANLRSLAAEAKNYGDVANALLTLETGIKVEVYANDWVAKEESWKSELKFVK